MLSTRISHQRNRSSEGSAFVISILILFVLSVLGMALMLTTTTEKDIAINHRWGEQAFFNADAALEYGKNILAQYALNNGDFAVLLPPPRADVTVPDDTRPWGEAHPELGAACNPMSDDTCRDYQYYVDQCRPDGSGPCVRVYIGRVLPRPDGTPAMYNFRNPGAAIPGDLDGDGTADVDGTTTLWVRRPILGNQDYGIVNASNPTGLADRVILTAEGTAPGAGGAGANRSVSLRRLEMTVRLPTGGIEGDRYGDSSRTSSPDALSGGSTAGFGQVGEVTLGQP